jgi:ATP-dependent DNA helicase RecG
MFRWAKLAENAGFGYDKMLAWKYKVEFDSNIDYSEATFYLGEKIVDSVTSKKTDEKTDFTPPITPPITELERKLLGIIEQNPKGNRKEYAGKLGISEGVVKEYTAKLKQKGIIERVGNNRTGYWEIINN